jgi:hypothetical protein
MTKKELDFAVFCVESVAERLGICGAEMYEKLTSDCDILDGYIIEHYDILHTQGKEYIVNDIIELIERGGLLK